MNEVAQGANGRSSMIYRFLYVLLLLSVAVTASSVIMPLLVDQLSDPRQVGTVGEWVKGIGDQKTSHSWTIRSMDSSGGMLNGNIAIEGSPLVERANVVAETSGDVIVGIVLWRYGPKAACRSTSLTTACFGRGSSISPRTSGRLS